MNLLKKHTTIVNEPGKIILNDFRQEQFNMLGYFLDLSMKYVSKQNKNYLDGYKITIKDKFSYCGLYNNEIKEVCIEINVDHIDKDTGEVKTEVKKLLDFYVPNLVDKQFYILNGTIYVPTMYILDKPISIKKSSFKLYGLFNSLTAFLEKNMVIFTGINMPFDYFYQLFLNSEEDIELYKKIAKDHSLVEKIHTTDNIEKYFDGIIKKSTIAEAQAHFDNLLIDDYTKELYCACYNMKPEDVTTKNLFKMAIDMFVTGKVPAYINLNAKRIMFMELMLAPVFKVMARVAQQASIGYKVDEMKLDKFALIKYFLKNKEKKSKSPESIGLSGNYIYNIANLMSSVMVHKVCFKNPGSDNPPSTISNLHKSHFRRICPVTVSNENPGETLSILPDIKLDKFGQFL
jgi:hypothetical protein